MNKILSKRKTATLVSNENAVVQHVRKRQIGRRTLVGYIFGAWLAGVFIASAIGRALLGGGTAFSLLQAFSISWPLFYFMFGKNRFVPAKLPTGSIVALVIFFIFTSGSLVASPSLAVSVPYFLITLAVIFLILQFNTAITPGVLEKGLKVFSALMVVSLVAFAALEYKPGSRLGGVFNPNALALMSMSVVVAAMAYRNIAVRVTIAGAAAVVIFLTGSRASALSAILALLVILYIRRRTASIKNKIIMFMALILLSGVAVYFMESLLSGFEKFFAMHDRYRGVTSGATGRFEAWKEAWDLFVAHPVFGVGYRAHEFYMTQASSSHNGYLALLAEVGIFAFLSIVYLILSGVKTHMRRLKEGTHLWTEAILIGFIAGFLFLAIFERFLINIGNPAALLFLVAILSYRHRSVSSYLTKHD